MTDLVSRVGRRLRRSLAGLRPPRVGVVVVVHGVSTGLDACLDALLASPQPLDVVLAAAPDDVAAARLVADAVARAPRVRAVVPSPDGPWLDAAVDALGGEYVGFVAADDVVPPDAFAALASALDRSGSDVALGVRVEVRGDRRRRVPWAGPVLRPATATTLEERPGLVVDVDPAGKLFRLGRWRAAEVRLGSWPAAPAAVAGLLAGGAAVDVVDRVAHESHDRQVSRPVQDQDRFRADVLTERWAGWSRVGEVLAPHPVEVRAAWQVGLLEHLLPPLYVDLVGGGPPYAAVLQAATATLLDEVPADVVARVSLAARLGAWVAAHGTPTDVALLQDHLADHPHGLPTVAEPGGTVATLPTGLTAAPPREWRRVEAVDRRLRSRVAVGSAGPGLLRLVGAAFVEHDPDGPLPVVRIGDRAGSDEREVTVRRHRAPDLDLWAARAHEDRGGCGFVAHLGTDSPPGAGAGPWRVTVELGGQVREHLVSLPAGDTAAHVTLSALRLAGDSLHATVDGAEPCRIRLAGTNASTEPVPADVEGDELALTLATTQHGARSLLPAGTYEVEARSTHGRALRVGLPESEGDVELVGDRLRLVPRSTGTGVAVVVACPPGPEDRSARGQQRLLDDVYRSGRTTPRPGGGGTRVLLETFRGRSAGDNPGAVGRALLGSARARAAGLDVSVVVDDPSVVVPDGARAVVRRTREWYARLADAHLYVANAGAPYWFEASPGQLHVQTWHGTPLKRIGEDRGPGDFSTWRHRRRIAAQAQGWDAMLSPSRYCSDIFRSAFGFTGPVLEVGSPRNDVLLAPDAAARGADVRARLGLAASDRVVLYAPTWREYVGVRDAKPMYLDAEAVVRALPDAVVLVRGHYNSTTQDDLFTRHPRIHDVTRYPDIADLYLAADALVTDYSSVMFDFVLTDRPVVLLVPDLDRYRDVERGFYFDIETRSPGPLVTTTAEVVDVLTAPDTWGARREGFRTAFCPFEDGSASARVVEYCLDRLSATSSSATPTERSP